MQVRCAFRPVNPLVTLFRELTGGVLRVSIDQIAEICVCGRTIFEQEHFFDVDLDGRIAGGCDDGPLVIAEGLNALLELSKSDVFSWVAGLIGVISLFIRVVILDLVEVADRTEAIDAGIKYVVGDPQLLM